MLEKLKIQLEKSLIRDNKMDKEKCDDVNFDSGINSRLLESDDDW